jgi:hypothetical protein
MSDHANTRQSNPASFNSWRISKDYKPPGLPIFTGPAVLAG